MKTLFNSYLLQTADAVLQENGINAQREQTLTLEGKILTALYVYDYSVCFWDTLKKVQQLLPFASVQNTYSHKITITAK